MTVDTITDGVVVSLAYTLTVDGKEIESAGRDEPLDYLHGAGNIVPGLEELLEGKRVGDRIHATLPPDMAYGDYDPEETDEFERELLEIDVDLEVGMEVEVEDEDGYTYVATVTKLTDDTVTLDFNPPLAGKTLTYDLEVVALRPATRDEIDHGHVHHLHDHDF
ncbi:MAG TPA: peptidylprolyl isomerase [Spirillospora sp.]|nr:peptidylprolyl isomerase [Spirillospora sp.]